MKKLILIILSVMLILPAMAQKYMTRNGYIGFFSHTPMEDIQADNNQVASVLDISTGDIVFQALMKSFKFERSLMEEHFNENYVESEKFPKSSFSGKILNPESVNFKSDGVYDVKVEGDLTIHGVTRKVSADGKISVSGDKINAASEFILSPEDYGIEIPGIVRDKIAKEIKVNVDMKYSSM